MAELSEQFIWGPKRMKRLAFALTGAAALTLAACGSSNQDQVSNAELNQPAAELNEQANEAAMNVHSNKGRTSSRIHKTLLESKTVKQPMQAVC